MADSGMRHSENEKTLRIVSQSKKKDGKSTFFLAILAGKKFAFSCISQWCGKDRSTGLIRGKSNANNVLFRRTPADRQA